MPVRRTDIEVEIRSIIDTHWAERNQHRLPGYDGRTNLYEAGLVDSFLLVELVAVIEERWGVEVDFLQVEPELFFTMDGICDFVSARQDAPDGASP